MPEYIPTNDLDRALIAVQRSTSAMPDLYLLVPYHPEVVVDQAIEIKNGAPFPFAMLNDEEGEVVPIFSSTERAEEGLTRAKVPPSTFLVGSMPAVQVLEVLGKMNMRAVINKSCSTPEFTMPPDLMRDLASGEVLEPLPEGERQTYSLNLLDPADFPTCLVQSVFEYCRRQKQYRAAWIFQSPSEEAKAAPEGGHGYHLAFLMDPRDMVIHHDLNLVMAAALSESKDQITHGLVDETDPVAVAELFGKAQPFYLAADFAQPRQT